MTPSRLLLILVGFLSTAALAWADATPDTVATQAATAATESASYATDTASANAEAVASVLADTPTTTHASGGAHTADTPAAKAKDKDKCCEPCCPRFPSWCSMDLCSWKDCMPKIKCHELYLSANASWNAAHKFNGWGGSVRMGWFFSRPDEKNVTKGHALELEFNYLPCHARQSQSVGGGFTGVTGISSTLALTVPANGTLVQQRKSTVDIIPIMINYRYHGSMEGWFEETKCLDKVLWYVGGGLGMGAMHYKDVQKDYAYTNMGDLSGAEERTTAKKTNICYAMQFMGGFGYHLMDYLSLFTGFRAFLTQQKRFGSNSITPLRMAHAHLIVDMGVIWYW